MYNGEHVAVRNKLDSYATGLLDDVDWVQVRTHLAECDLCQAELAQPALEDRASPYRIFPRDSAFSRSSTGLVLRRSLPVLFVLLGVLGTVTVVSWALVLGFL